MTDRHNTYLAAKFDVVVCTTAWAAAEFERLPAGQLGRVPLGVDLAGLHPDLRDPAWRDQRLAGAEQLVVMVSRLSREKRPALTDAPHGRCLGDSFSCGEGVGLDIRPVQTWTALLCQALPGSRLANLSTAGARVRDVRRIQLPEAVG